MSTFVPFQLIIRISTGTCSRDITRCSRFTRLWVSLVTQDTPLITPPTTRAASPTHPIHRESHIHRYVHHSIDRLNKIIFLKQECIPVGCVPSAAVAVSPAMHAPMSCMTPSTPATHSPCHAPATHSPCHGHPSAMHIPLPCMPPCHAHPSPCHTFPLPWTPLCHACPHTTHAPLCISPPMDRMTDAYENITFPQLLLRTVIKPDIDSSLCVPCSKQLVRNRNRFRNKHQTFHKMINLLNGYRQ